MRTLATPCPPLGPPLRRLLGRPLGQRRWREILPRPQGEYWGEYWGHYRGAHQSARARGSSAFGTGLAMAGLVLSVVLSVVPSKDAMAQGWHYTIGEAREDQQANFCRDRDEVELLFQIFERYGARPGFAALSSSPQCWRGVGSFVPKALWKSIAIEKGKPTEYVVRFIEVEGALKGGEVERYYLVTTRDLVDP